MIRSIGYGQKPIEIETHSLQRTQLEHTPKQYIDGQLTAINMKALSCQTTQAQFRHNSGHGNMQFLVWPVHITFARQ